MKDKFTWHDPAPFAPVTISYGVSPSPQREEKYCSACSRFYTDNNPNCSDRHTVSIPLQQKGAVDALTVVDGNRLEHIADRLLNHPKCGAYDSDVKYLRTLAESGKVAAPAITEGGQPVSHDVYVAAVNGRREFREMYRKALRVVRAAEPFAKIITESVGRIPTERLSLANWHELSKAMREQARKGLAEYDAATPSPQREEGESIPLHTKGAVAWICHGPYDEGEETRFSLVDPKDDDSWSPLFARAAQEESK